MGITPDHSIHPIMPTPPISIMGIPLTHSEHVGTSSQHLDVLKYRLILGRSGIRPTVFSSFIHW